MARTLEEILANEKPEIVEKAKEQATEILLNIRLSELRELVQKTQVEMAELLNVKQPTVANLERVGQDMKLSSLKRYVEATGSKLSFDIELPDGSHYGFRI